ncbi:MAG: hypothetical protein EOM67_10350 [Spirochaetia bacterium]|nr:hypothetical protein [Spirochaetia bacterium]
MSCSLKERKLQNASRLLEYADDFTKVITALETHDIKDTLLDMRRVANTKDGMISYFFGEEFKDYEDFASRSTDDQKEYFRSSINSTLQVIWRNAERPMELLTAVNAGRATYKYLKYLSRLEAAPTLLSGTYRKIMSVFGVNGLAADSFMPKQAKLEQYEPARKAFFYMDVIRNYSDNASKALANRVDLLLTHTAKDSAFTDNKITKDKLIKLIPYVDGGRLLEDGINDTNLRSEHAVGKFMLFASTRDVDLDLEESTRIYNRLLKFREDFNVINYGKTLEGDTFDGDKLYNEAPDDTILGFIRNLRKDLHNMKDEMDKTGVILDEKDSDKINKILDRLDSFTPRKNYLPFNGEKDSMFTVIRDTSLEHDVNLAHWLNERKSSDINGDVGDFLGSFHNNLFGTSFMANDLAMFMSSAYLNKSLSLDEAWFSESSARKEIYANVRNLVSSIDKLLLPSDVQRTQFAKTVYEMQNMMSIIPVMMLMKPLSAFKNIISGNMALMQRIGLEYKDKSGKYAEYKVLRDIVESEADKHLVSVGMSEEFRAYKASQAFDPTERVSRFADFIAEGFGIGNYSETYHKFLTVKGTEEGLRKHTKPLLFNRAYKEIIAKGIDINDDSPANVAKIKAIVDDLKIGVYYDVNAALGNYNPLNKPYTFHLMQKTADTRSMIILGGLLRWTYIFRHASFSVMENYITGLTKLSNPEASMKNKAISASMMGSLLVGGFIGLYEILKDTLGAEMGDYKYAVPILDAANPMQEVAPLKGLYALTASILDLPMDKDTADQIAVENLRFFGGLAIDPNKDMVRDIENGQYIRALIPKMDPGYRLYDAVMNPHISDPKATEFDLLKKERAIGQGLGVFNNLNPVSYAKNIYAYFNIKATNNDKATEDFRKEYFMNTFGRLTGFTYWSENKRYKKLYYSKYDGYYNKSTYDRYQSANVYFKENNYIKNSDEADKVLDYISKYGRLPKGGMRI